MKKLLLSIIAITSCAFVFCQPAGEIPFLGLTDFSSGGRPLSSPLLLDNPSRLTEGLTGGNIYANFGLVVGDQSWAGPLVDGHSRIVSPYSGYETRHGSFGSGTAWGRIDGSLTVNTTPNGFNFTLLQISHVTVEVDLYYTETVSDFKSQTVIFMYLPRNARISMNPRITIYSNGSNRLDEEGLNIGSIKLYRYRRASSFAISWPQLPRDILDPSPFGLEGAFPPFNGNETIRPGNVQRDVEPGLYGIEVSARSRAGTYLSYSHREHRTIATTYVEVTYI